VLVQWHSSSEWRGKGRQRRNSLRVKQGTSRGRSRTKHLKIEEYRKKTASELTDGEREMGAVGGCLAQGRVRKSIRLLHKDTKVRKKKKIKRSEPRGAVGGGGWGGGGGGGVWEGGGGGVWGVSQKMEKFP